MIDPATKAREAASHCEGKLHAFRKTQDGVVVSFVLHPQEVPASLQLAPLGTRYVLALVEVGDDELPKQEGTIAAATANGTQQQPAPGHTSHSVQTPVRAPRRWEDITPAQQAGIRCNEPAFVEFLSVQYKGGVSSTEAASELVRELCGVKSRSDIRIGDPSGSRWRHIERSYQTWLLAERMGAA